MNKKNIKKKQNHWHSRKKPCISPNFRRKMCILPNSKVKKSVYTDKISMGGRSVPYSNILFFGIAGISMFKLSFQAN